MRPAGLALAWFVAAQAGAFELSAPTPGEPDRTNEAEIRGATPGAAIELYRAAEAGADAAGACPSGLTTPQLLGSADADAQGVARISFDIAAEDGGAEQLLQAIAPAECAATAPLAVTWRVAYWDGVWDPEVADAKWRGQHTVDVFGSRVSVEGDGDGDGVPDLLVAAPMEDEAGETSGSVYVFYGPGPGVFLAGRDEDLELTGVSAGDWAGFGMSWGGDVDGDGDDDVLVGSRFHAANGEAAGAVYLVAMPRSGPQSLAVADLILWGGAPGDQLGIDVGPGEDGDGDGLPDFWASAPLRDGRTGAAFLVPGTLRGEHVVEEVAVAALVGEAPEDQAGMEVDLVGDIDGDGLRDVGLGAEGSDRNGPERGAAYVVTTPPAGTVSLSDADVILTGADPTEAVGGRVLGLGDLDGDGRADLGVHARGDSTGGATAGAISIVAGPPPDEATLADARRAHLYGVTPGGHGGAHAAACDVNGDGALDLLVTAHEAGEPGPQTGQTSLFYGPLPDGSVPLDAAEVVFSGDEPTQNLGQGVSCADLDDDGLADFVIGSEGDTHAWGGFYAGSVYLFRGRAVDDPGGEPPPPDDEPGCGCAGAPGGGAGWAAAAVALIVARRARRSA